MNEEIERTSATAEKMLRHVDDNELDTQVADAIANLLILCHERQIGTADVVVRGAAHYAATYMEGMEPDEAQAWLSESLFPWTGEREFAEYIADRAIVLSGHAGRVATPEWGI
jgi:hypothetical protein